ncbi:MAG: GNAT family N-acetyltransferase [Planctomycetota bacterium]|nr:GNAT family N-acetyltransferase [Planctomycetota bacterium]
MATTLNLKDGTEVIIRPMRPDDADRSYAFFQALKPADRAYLRVDVTRRGFVEKRIRAIETENVKRLVAVIRDQIVADGALEILGKGWKDHIAELRLIVSHQFQNKGLGTLMARELYRLAAHEKIEEVVVKMMRPQEKANFIFKKLGFMEESALPDYVRDISGNKQDLILMRCDLAALWREIEDRFAESDWGRTR